MARLRTECAQLPGPLSGRALLEVCDLCVSYRQDSGPQMAVQRLGLQMQAGEVLGLQGPSGCGKTSVALALLKLLPPATEVSGRAWFHQQDLLGLSNSELRQIRGRKISIMYQESALALNPVMRVGDQIGEVLRAHTALDRRERRERVGQMLESVHLNPRRFYSAYPHELSGGERHRIVLAQALICRPELVIADEPTAGLDPALKREVLTVIGELRKQFGAAFLLISHDRETTEALADKTINLTTKVKQESLQWQTGTSLGARVPAASSSRNKALLTVRHLSKRYGSRGVFTRDGAEKQALDCVDLTIRAGATLAIVGPSGSGKSTLARSLALLESADTGEIFFDGKNLLALKAREMRRYRPLLQYVPQDPAAALNPRFSAADAITEPLLIQSMISAKNRTRRAKELMTLVGLDASAADRCCHEFSGGQKQRIAIARAVASNPKLLIFDESLSGLDPATQRDILQLIDDLRQELDIAILLISHDPELVASVADSVLVMREGRIVERSSSGLHSDSASFLPTASSQEPVLMEVE